MPTDLQGQRAHLQSLVKQLVGSTQRKLEFLKTGRVTDVVALLDPPLDPNSLELALATSSEAAAVLSSLSIPEASREAVSILLAADAQQAAARAFSRLYSDPSPPNIPQATVQRYVEVHLRALKALYVDLVRVVGPRPWGTDIIGTSVDPAERRDAEEVPGSHSLLWLDKGKGKAGPVEAEPSGDELRGLQSKANGALEYIYALSSTSTLGPSSAGPSTFSHVPVSGRLSPTLHALLSLLVDCVRPDDARSTISTSPQRIRIADLVCKFLSGTVRTPSQRRAIAQGGKGKETLAALQRLTEEGPDKVRESALQALTAIVRDSHDALVTLLGLGATGGIPARLQNYRVLTQSAKPSIRLAAATFCAVLTKTLAIPRSLRECSSEVQVLLNLIAKEPDLRNSAAFAFAYLVADEPELQQRAAAASCFDVIAEVVNTLYDGCTGKIHLDADPSEGLLLALATLTATSETNRRLLLDAKLMRFLVGSLAHPCVGVRAAACHVVRALSRSVNVLRTDLVECHAEVCLVFLLREDENEVVKITAVALFANLLLEFSPMRNILCQAGCVPRISQLAVRGGSEALRLNALWAVKNAVYQSTASFKRDLLKHLTWDDLASLASSPSPALVEQALGILQNITCVTQNEAITGLADDEMGETRMLDLLEAKLARGPEGANGQQIVLQALYCLNNIATAHEAAQLAIASRTTLLRYILGYLDSYVTALRTAALWVLHNLVYHRGGLSAYCSVAPAFGSPRRRRPQEIVDKLRVLGLDNKLRMMERDPELDVRERVRDLKEAME
ncbi:hypothetical protein JCM10212_004942 [Sporobolomyces blumeae]